MQKEWTATTTKPGKTYPVRQRLVLSRIVLWAVSSNEWLQLWHSLHVGYLRLWHQDPGRMKEMNRGTWERSVMSVAKCPSVDCCCIYLCGLSVEYSLCVIGQTYRSGSTWKTEKDGWWKGGGRGKKNACCETPNNIETCGVVCCVTAQKVIKNIASVGWPTKSTWVWRVLMLAGRCYTTIPMFEEWCGQEMRALSIVLSTVIHFQQILWEETVDTISFFNCIGWNHPAHVPLESSRVLKVIDLFMCPVVCLLREGSLVLTHYIL